MRSTAPLGRSRARAAGPTAALRWIGLGLAVVALAGVCVRLGAWQLDRLEQRRGDNARVARNSALPAEDHARLLAHGWRDDLEWRAVWIVGVFDADAQLEVRYRRSGGRPGVEVLTPLVTASGPAVLIDRGFLPDGAAGPAQIPPPPTGEVRLTGRLRRDERGPDHATAPDGGGVRLIASAAVAKGLGYPLAAGYVSLSAVAPPQSGALEPIAPPAPDEGPHLSYALQWFCFAAIAVGGGARLIRADAAAGRAAAKAAGRDAGSA